MYDYLIVGAGLFGSVFAHEAVRAGKKCLVLERRGHIGGNCYTESVADIQVHRYGAHIFRTSRKDIWDYMCQFTEFNHFVNCPIANFHGEIYNMPFNMNTFSKMWGISRPCEARAIIEAQRKEIGDEARNLEERVIQLVGRDVYEKLVRGYTEKQWGRPCSELPASIIRRLPVRFTYDNNYYDDPYQGIPKGGGYTENFTKLLSGCEVMLGIDYNSHRDEFASLAKKCIYTGTIDSFFAYCYGPLEYRSLRFETEILDIENYQGVAVVNYTDRETPYTRIIEHKHFDFGKQPNTVISREYPLEWTLDKEPYYPINNEANQKRYAQYLELAQKESDIIFGGRLGEYRYYEMQDTIISALNLAHKELSNNKYG